METGNKVFALLGVKAMCCGLLILSAAGLLGGFTTTWLIEGSGRWATAGAVATLIVWVVFGRQRRTASETNISSKQSK